jgi:radical SAM superfamily enzyme
MESKGLNIKSFHRNQKLLDAINLLLINLKLSAVNIQSKIEDEKIQSAKSFLASFLDQLEKLVAKVEKREEEPLIGADTRLRNFAKSFVEAKGRRTKFKSALFQSNISGIKMMLQSDCIEDSQELVQSLTELRILLEEQISIDSKSIINEI